MTARGPIPSSRREVTPERLLPADAAELTDPDGDGLTLTAFAEGIWLTCTDDGDEVTVGPFAAGALQAALESVGDYTRVA